MDPHGGQQRFPIAGRTVEMPVVVRDAFAASATFRVDRRAAAQLLPDGLELVRVPGGRALLVLAAVSYADNDLGAYDELAVALVARGPGGERGVYIHRLPVDDAFSDAAGRGIWGFPKTVEQLRVERADRVVRCRWDADGASVLRLALRSSGVARLPPTAQRAFSVRAGVLCSTRFVLHLGRVGARTGGARVAIGAGAPALELRALGLPRAAVATLSAGRLRARFEGPEPLGQG